MKRLIRALTGLIDANTTMKFDKDLMRLRSICPNDINELKLAFACILKMENEHYKEFYDLCQHLRQMEGAQK